MSKNLSPFATFFKEMRKKASLTQEDLAKKAGVGLRFVRDVEQGKKNIQLNTLNTVLSLFGYCAGPIRMEREDDHT